MSCSSGIEERSKSAAEDFVTAAEKGKYDELAQLVDSEKIKSLKLKYTKAIDTAKSKNLDKATVNILFGDNVNAGEIKSLSEYELLELIINREFEKHRISNFELIGTICESESKCFAVVKISREGLDANRLAPHLLVLNSYDEGDTWHIDPEFFMTTRLIHSYAKKSN